MTGTWRIDTTSFLTTFPWTRRISLFSPSSDLWLWALAVITMLTEKASTRENVTAWILRKDINLLRQCGGVVHRSRYSRVPLCLS